MGAMLDFAASLLGIGAWVGRRRSRAAALARRAAAVQTRARAQPGARVQPGAYAQTAVPAQSAAPAQSAVEVTPLEAANALAADRLWKLAFGVPANEQGLEPPRRVRDNIVAMLKVDTLDPKYFPRRPALMPQLLQAVNDPRAAAEKLSRIIAHDPVLTADVLRLANSSLYRMSPAPIETIPRALVVCGVDALRGMLAAAMLRPAFRATRRNFPRLPRMLWERTERAVRAAELYAMALHPQDRFESQMVVLLSALGPLAVYGAALDVYARNPHFPPSGALYVELIGELAQQMSLRIARDWQTSPRLLDALGNSPGEPLCTARHVGELFGTLSLLESQTVIARDERLEFVSGSGLPVELAGGIWAGLNRTMA